MHQTLYRKYRPKTLEEVCGQEVIVTILKNQLKNNAISHAYLFSGPRGTGKTSVAKILAAAVNCEADDKPCLECGFCNMKVEENLDVIEIDAASNNGVEEIRELKKNINFIPSDGAYKVYIVDEVHMLSSSAFNALLKTLEDPPRYTIFILATTEPQKIPETILSRCQRLDFRRVSISAIAERLKQIKEKEAINITDEALLKIAHIVKGGMRDAIGLLEQARAYNPENITELDIDIINGSISDYEIEELIDFVLRKQFNEILEKVDFYYQNGRNMQKVLEEIISYLRTSLINFQKGKDENLFFKEMVNNLNYHLILEETMKLNATLFEMKRDNDPKTLLAISLINLANNIGGDDTNQETPIQPLEKPIIRLMGEEKGEDKEDNESNEDAATKNETTTDQKIEKEDGSLDVEGLKRLRVDNTFAKNSRKFKKELEELLKRAEIDLAKQLPHGHLLVDGQVKAASAEHQYFIIAFDSATCSDLYNRNLKEIEGIIKRILKMELKTIAVNYAEWEFFRNEFKEKKREYIFKRENGEVEKHFAKNQKAKNEIEKKFSRLVNKK